MEAYDALASELAEGYDHHFETSACLEADYFLTRLNQGGRILDLGCGVGSASRYFAGQGCQTVSADLSQAMLMECRRRGLSDLARLDMENLPFPPATFEGIWAHTSLLHIPKQRVAGVIRRLAEILKTGGALFIALREGTKEGYEGQPGVERWFANYQAGEIDTFIRGEFCIERCSRNDRHSTVFLNYHLRKTTKIF